MSAATPNFFAVLSDDSAPAVGSNAVHLDGTPKTSSSTSSKKSDSNPRADPARARARAPGAPSNDRILRESKNAAGRSNNRSVPVHQGAPSHQSRRHDQNDRKERSGKRDTAKRTRSGWGDEKGEPKEQAAGEVLAKEDEHEEVAEDAEDNKALAQAAHSAPAAPKVTFDQYMQSQRAQADALNTRKPKVSAPAAAPAAAPADSVPEPRKKHSNKPRKEVETLPLDASAAPPLLRENDRRSNEHRSSEHRPTRSDKPGRGKPGSKGRSAPKAKFSKKESSPTIDLKALPTLN